MPPLLPFLHSLQVLYDLGVVSCKEPFQRLVSQGMILGEVEFTIWRDAQVSNRAGVADSLCFASCASGDG